MTFYITNTALSQINKNLETSKMPALRVGIKKSGCSGFKYFLDFADAVQETDIILNDQMENRHLLNSGFVIITNQESLKMLENVTLDYVKQGLNQSFKFSNPNAVAECGCGESFSL